MLFGFSGEVAYTTSIGLELAMRRLTPPAVALLVFGTPAWEILSKFGGRDYVPKEE